MARSRASVAQTAMHLLSAPTAPRGALRQTALVACLSAALVPISAAAGPFPGQQATDLDAVEVHAERPEISSTSATRLALSPRETPQSISRITREQMDDFGLDSINEVL